MFALSQARLLVNHSLKLSPLTTNMPDENNPSSASNLESAKSHARDAVDATRAHLKEAVDSSREHLKSAAGDIRAAAEAKAREFRGTYEAKAREFRGRAEQTYGETRERVRTFQDEGEAYVRENPTRAVLTAVAAGFVLGLIFRR